MNGELAKAIQERDFFKRQLHDELTEGPGGWCAIGTCAGARGDIDSHTGLDCPLSDGRDYGPGVDGDDDD